MQFDNLPSNPYLNIISELIRKGITQCVSKLNNSDNEDLKNQLLVDTFNTIGTVSEQLWIGVGRENKSKEKQTREDIYFYLNDDNFTRIFYVEGKRLPKYNTQSNEEYVIGTNIYGNSSGGIERFKKGIHGDSYRIFDNGLIAYIENNSIEYWLKIVNNSISLNYSSDEILKLKEHSTSEYVSLHQFVCDAKLASFRLHHFWINLSN
jgi:hypothetical protein